MTLTEMLEKLGGIPGFKGEALLPIDELRIRVRVTDMRKVFNRVDVLVEPVAGKGRKWVEANRLQAVDGRGYLEG